MKGRGTLKSACLHPLEALSCWKLRRTCLRPRTSRPSTAPSPKPPTILDARSGTQSGAIQHQDFDVLKRTLGKSAELGLIGVLLPESYGGMELDLVSSMIVAEGIGRDGSYAVCHGAQAGIGALPVLLFGTEQQKEKYLPRLASAELMAAYCAHRASCRIGRPGRRTRADLSPDGSHYVLNGQKMWITNGGFADLFTVFAKVGGEKFTAFLVERGWPGVSPGAEEKKMGLKGSSTVAVYFDNVKVPVENVLGEIGRGHIIAFNILNIGRLKLAVLAHGGVAKLWRIRSLRAGAPCVRQVH